MSDSAARLGRRAAIILVSGSALSVLASAPSSGTELTRLYVLGDSWAAGLYADPDRAFAQVAASRLNWDVHVDGASGTGYVEANRNGAAYPDRVASIAHDVLADVVVVQGGSNDRGHPLEQIGAAADETVRRLSRRFPDAVVLMLGPGPDPEPVTAAQRAVDRTLQAAAGRASVRYVSMLQLNWIPAATADRVLSPVNHHPTVAGQAYLGAKLAAVLLSTRLR